MSSKARIALILSAAGAIAVAVGVTVTIGHAATGSTGPKSRIDGGDPAAVTVHRSTQDPDQVRRYWTPERIEQANDNTRSRRGPQF